MLYEHSADPGLKPDSLEGIGPDESDPIVIGGGPCTYNPEPLADFIDLFMVGDGEDLLEQVCLLKMKYDSKEDFLKEACKLQGVYVPDFYEPIYNEDGTIKEIKKLYEGAPDRVKRAVVQDLDYLREKETELYNQPLTQEDEETLGENDRLDLAGVHACQWPASDAQL